MTTLSTIKVSATTKASANQRPARAEIATAGLLPSTASAMPGRDCPLCPRLVEFRHIARVKNPDWFNAPVPSFGDEDAQLLIVGLAPGMQGANRTGRPFTGDYAGDLLYATLKTYGFAEGIYQARRDDGFLLRNCRIVNAVRCVPPLNKPLPIEINACRPFLIATMAQMPRLRAIVALGRIAHESAVKALGLRAAAAPFRHGGVHEAGTVRLYDSYHCSRYNTNTRVLTPEMFEAVFARVKADLEKSAATPSS